MYTVTLSNGTKLENLVQRGNSFVSDVIVEDSVFEGGLNTVVISDGETSETYMDMMLMSNYVSIVDGKSWFVLGEKTKQQKKEEALQKEILELKSALNVLLTGNEA